jgi:hypothetical protein
MLKVGINFLFATVQIMITNGVNVMTELGMQLQD